MKMIRVNQFGPPEVQQLEEVPSPKPGAGQVLVAIKAVGVNPVETYIRTGQYAIKPALPYTPGSDAAGIVEAVGDGVQSVHVGDRVYTGGSITGTYAEKALCAESQVHPLPDRVSFPAGAAINVPYATAYRAIFHRARTRPGETMLIHGASGGVGLAALQWARSAGITIIATAGTDRGRQLVRDQGATHVLDHRESDHFARVMDLTEGRGADVILEMLANVNLARDLDVLARFGRVVVIGNRGTIEINPRATMARDASILGMTLMNATPAELVEIHAAIAAGLRAGALDPIVGREMPLAEAARAHHEVIEATAYGKIVLMPLKEETSLISTCLGGLPELFTVDCKPGH